MQWDVNTCRICGQIQEQGHPIFNNASSNDIVHKIKKCLKLELFKEDYKPKQLCNYCMMKLDSFYQFLTICHATDQKFNALLQNWQPTETILDYTQQKMSVIVTTTPTKPIEQLDCTEIDLYKESVLPLNEDEMLEIVENATNSYTSLDYLAPNYGMKKFQNNDFYQDPSLLRHSNTNYQIPDSLNYNCQQETFPDLNYTNVGLDYTNYPSRETRDEFPEYIETPPQKIPTPPPQRTFQCPHCEKVFKRRVTLNSHIAVHTKIRPFVCDICKKSYAIKCDLTNHMTVHTNRNKCKYCSSSFSAPSKLERHLRTHTKDKPFICDFKDCNKSFSDKRNLDGHKLLHTDVFNFACKECGKVFRTKNRLKQHGKSHIVSQEYVCDICSKAYKYKSTLIFHLKKHNGYVCSYCEENCEKRVKLIKHKRICPNRQT